MGWATGATLSPRPACYRLAMPGRGSATLRGRRPRLALPDSPLVPARTASTGPARASLHRPVDRAQVAGRPRVGQAGRRHAAADRQRWALALVTRLACCSSPQPGLGAVASQRGIGGLVLVDDVGRILVVDRLASDRSSRSAPPDRSCPSARAGRSCPSARPGGFLSMPATDLDPGDDRDRAAARFAWPGPGSSAEPTAARAPLPRFPADVEFENACERGETGMRKPVRVPWHGPRMGPHSRGGTAHRSRPATWQETFMAVTVEPPTRGHDVSLDGPDRLDPGTPRRGAHPLRRPLGPRLRGGHRHRRRLPGAPAIRRAASCPPSSPTRTCAPAGAQTRHLVVLTAGTGA